ncbi:MAG: SDR family NAD(P)-dependent oxidoreductase [Pseudomonadota bacterium]
MTTTPKTILVLGATKGIGRATVERALAQGHRVRAFARNPDALDLTDEGLEKVAGDALDPVAVAGALEGVDAVAYTLGVPINRDTVMGQVDFFSRTTAVLLEAMAAAGVRRLVAVTGFGAGDSRDVMSVLERLGHGAILGRIYDDKTRQEALIRESDTDWTIARPVILTSGGPSGRYLVMEEPAAWRNGLISRADVADYIVRAIEESSQIHGTPVLAYGPAGKKAGKKKAA